MSISVHDLNVHLGSNHVLRGVNFTIEPGERVAVLGPNGCGKSTLLRTIAGIIKPTSGEVRLEGESLYSHRRRARAQKLGLLNQADVVPMMTTVRDHVAIGRHPHRSFLRDASNADAMSIDEAIRLCEIDHLAHRRVERLSGGERQRVRLATLFAQAPETMLLDEPLTGLDLEHRYGLLHMLEDLNHEQRKTVMVVLHDLDMAIRFFDRLLVIHDGKLVADGEPNEVMTSVLLEEVFRINGIVGREPTTGQPVIVCQRGIPSPRMDLSANDPAAVKRII